ncbi:translation initiation factor IF-2-like [Equus quagga]|uniref:translation initiation factor IF-2-like n=1 Tax=Equus quagga TaxID=89248 RepID=UPI001EE39B7A|nr:translation initiation factor IF-2-like [Equus quagga]XP_046542259.1 translation initiation factor IF-2-like [Equus quagga]
MHPDPQPAPPVRVQSPRPRASGSSRKDSWLRARGSGPSPAWLPPSPGADGGMSRLSRVCGRKAAPGPAKTAEEETDAVPSGRPAGPAATCQEGGGAGARVNTADICRPAGLRPLLTLAAQVPGQLGARAAPAAGPAADGPGIGSRLPTTSLGPGVSGPLPPPSARPGGIRPPHTSVARFYPGAFAQPSPRFEPGSCSHRLGPNVPPEGLPPPSENCRTAWHRPTSLNTTHLLTDPLHPQ